MRTKRNETKRNDTKRNETRQNGNKKPLREQHLLSIYTVRQLLTRACGWQKFACNNSRCCY